MDPKACIYLVRDDTDPDHPLYKVGKSVRHCSVDDLHRRLHSYHRDKSICYFTRVSHRIAPHLESEIQRTFQERYRVVRPSWFDGDVSQMIGDMTRLIGEDPITSDGTDEKQLSQLRRDETTLTSVESIQEFHYGTGPTFRSARPITKGDIIRLCETLNQHPLYKDVCMFEPEPITEGGMVFRFLRQEQTGPRRCAVCRTCSGPWYKTIRFHYRKFIIVSKAVMAEWKDNDEVIFPSNYILSTHLKSFHGAPPFTTEELRILAGAFCTIGLVNPSVAVQRLDG